MSIKKSISNLRPEVFSRLSNDLRKSAYLMGLVLSGLCYLILSLLRASYSFFWFNYVDNRAYLC